MSRPKSRRRARAGSRAGVDELVRVGLAGGQDGPRRDPRPRRRTGRAARVARSSPDPRDRIPGRRSRGSGDDLASQDTFSRSRPRRDGMGRGSGWRGSSGPRRCVLSPARASSRIAQCELSATQSTPPRAVRAQRDTIRLRSILASPPGAMRSEVTSPIRLPRGWRPDPRAGTRRVPGRVPDLPGTETRTSSS